MGERRDERNTIFSRIFELEEGTEKYERYYERNPVREDQDRKLRNASGGVFADRLIEQRQIDAVFSLISDLRGFAGHSPSGDAGERLEIAADEASARVKRTALSYGAFKAGICRTESSWVYSVRGRGPYYDDSVDNFLPYTIVFAVEMDEAEINRAPAVEESVEVVKAYLQAGIAGLALKRIINAWGYQAVCHMDGMSEVILPPAAEAAGLGSIGLHGLLVTRECGPRVRLAAVTTDLPLEVEPPAKFNIRKFCRTCGRCAESCPAGSIRPFDEYREGERFLINHESCFGIWRDMATDCGVCLAACPFSHPNRGKAGENRDAAGGAGFLKDFMFGKGGG